MSREIDERVVKMEFDNKQFENGVSTTIATLSKLKNSLNFKGLEKTFSKVEDASNDVSFSGIFNGLDSVSNKFSALEVFAITAFQNIANQAISTGRKLIDAFAIAPIRTGFQEYETQINSVQTILANTSSKGTTLEQVNDALDQLNHYADMTIYNFTEMTRNIGTFTAAGVDLDTSVAAIKGIANLAAVSGSTSQQASTAMYQLSQALASGTVKLMDWNSVVNAGMGGQVFQDALKETARVHGVKIDEMIKKEGSFRETLSNGWLTSAILTETLQKFTGDLSEEQLKSIGYTDEQISGIMKMGVTANDAATKVKTFTQLMDTLSEAVQSGWTQSWEILVGDFEEAKALLTSVSDVFGGMISESAEARNKILQGWKDLGGRASAIKSVENVFKTFLSVVEPIREAFSNIFPSITAKQLFAITRKIQEFTASLRISSQTSENIKRTFEGLFSVFDIGLRIVSSLGKTFFSLAGSIFPISDSILGITASIGDFLVGIDNAVKESEIFDNIFASLGSVIKPVIDILIDFAEGVKEVIDSFDLFESSQSIFTTAFNSIGAGISAVSSVVESFISVIRDLLGNIGSSIFPFFLSFSSKVSEAVRGIGESIEKGFNPSNFETIFSIINGSLFAGVLKSFKDFVSSLTGITDNAGDFLDNIKGILDGVKDSLEVWQTTLKAKALLDIAKALGILAASIFVLSLTDESKLNSSLTAITIMFGELIGSMTAFMKIAGGKNIGKLKVLSNALIVMSAAILVLSFAVEKMAKLSWDQLGVGLVGTIGLLLGLAVVAAALSSQSKKLMNVSFGIIAFAAAVWILSDAVIALSSINTEELTNGLYSVVGLMAALGIMSKIMSNNKGMISTGLGLLIVSGALNILAIAVEKLGSMDESSISKGIFSVISLMIALGSFSKVVSGSKGMIGTAIGITIVAGSMVILADVIERIGNLSLENIMKGLLGVVGSLAAIVLALDNIPKGAITKSVSIVIMASAIMILSKSLESLGKLSVGQMAKSLFTLGTSLAFLVIALNSISGSASGSLGLIAVAVALNILIPALQALSNFSIGQIIVSLVMLAGVFAILGVAATALTPLAPVLLTISGAVALLGVGVFALGAGLTMLSGGIIGLSGAVASILALILGLISGVLGLIPMFLQQVGLAIVAFAGVIAQGAPAIGEAFLQVVLAVINVLVGAIPALVAAIVLLIASLLTAIAENLPQLIAAGVGIIMAILQGISDNIYQIVIVAGNIIVNFLNGLSMKLPDIVDAAANLVITFINTLANTFSERGPELVEAAINLGASIIEGIIKGLLDGIGKIWEAACSIGNKIIEGIKSVTETHSPSRKGIELGRYIDQGLSIGLLKYADLVEKSGKEVGKTAISSIGDSISGISSEINEDFNPVIRPIIDLDDVNSKYNVLNDLFSSRDFEMGFSMNRVSNVASRMDPINNQNGNNDTSYSPSMTFNQYNYSPKALSRLDIYRNTKNQFTMAKEAVSKR